MKNVLKYIVLIFVLAGISCQDEDKLPFERITNDLETAGGLRTITINSPTLDLNDVTNSEFSVTLEEWDDQDGGLFESVDVYVLFQDNTPDNGDSSKSEVLLKTIPASQFTVNSNTGLPQGTISVTAMEAITLFGLDPATEIDGGDIIWIRFALNLTDGSVFSSNNLEGNITGVFFNSPFRYPANIVCDLDASIFTGTYQLEWVSGTFDAFGGSPAYADGPVTITANSGTQRVIQNAPYLPAFGPFNGPLVFDLVCGRTIVPSQSAPISCSTAIIQQSGLNQGTFDPADDSMFTLIFNDETTGDCGATPYEVTLRFTKL